MHQFYPFFLYLCNMEIQYIIISVILLACVIYLARYIYYEVKENIQYKNYGCAGCAFYEKCKRSKKKIEKK